MSPTLTPDSTLETLKKQAKRGLKAIRAGSLRIERTLLPHSTFCSSESSRVSRDLCCEARGLHLP